MWKHQEKIHNTVMFGVGAGFNFFAGTLDKAPEWMEKASLEWLFRLSKEPKRLWRRYILGGFKYLYYTAEYKLKKKNEDCHERKNKHSKSSNGRSGAKCNGWNFYSSKLLLRIRIR